MNKIFRFFLCYLGGILLIMPFWINRIFGAGITVEQILFQLFSGVDGVAGTDFSIKRSFVLFNLVGPLAFPLLCTAFQMLFDRMSGYRRRELINNVFGIASLIFFVIGSIIFDWTINLHQYILSRFGNDTFSGLYADPVKQHFKAPALKKNLVLIYVESLETDLSDLRPNHINAIQEIDDLPGQQVRNFLQAPGTNWSIAGMIASQAGIPLKPYFRFNDGNSIKTDYLPNLYCLSDVLAKEGYVQYFLVGCDLKFNGMNNFYNSHHYNYVFGLDEWRSLGVDKKCFGGWGGGLYDDDLLDQAYRIIAENRLKRRNFAITIETLDTHSPNGIHSPRCCKAEAAEGFIGAFKYGSRYLSGFINRLISDGSLKDTDIIIMGDHLFMANDDQVKEHFARERRVYFKMITRENRKPCRDKMTHFDVAPTVLDLLGFRSDEDEHFGLGISLFSKISPSDYDLHLRQVLNSDILNRSVVYDHFWNSVSKGVARKY